VSPDLNDAAAVARLFEPDGILGRGAHQEPEADYISQTDSQLGKG
jgi:hypothetical protein